jgi:putative transposase
VSPPLGLGQATSPSTGRKYGLARVCRLWDLPRSTVYFHCHQESLLTEQRPEAKKRGPQGPCSDEELVGHIRRILAESPFHGESYRKVWARLRYQGLWTSKERVLRLTREHDLQSPQQVGHPHGPKAHDARILTERPDEMWGTDMTTTVTTEEGQVCVFVAVDPAMIGSSVAVRNEPWPVYLSPPRADISVRARS